MTQIALKIPNYVGTKWKMTLLDNGEAFTFQIISDSECVTSTGDKVSCEVVRLAPQFSEDGPYHNDAFIIFNGDTAFFVGNNLFTEFSNECRAVWFQYFDMKAYIKGNMHLPDGTPRKVEYLG